MERKRVLPAENYVRIESDKQQAINSLEVNADRKGVMHGDNVV